MRVIISRKGFDSSYGGVASPILDDDTLLSLPIPLPSRITYDELSTGGIQLGRVVADLTDGSITGNCHAHLDPDLDAEMYHTRLPGWRPIFGQVDAAQAHLDARGVTEGDVFLFFGWFRKTNVVRGQYHFVRDAPDLHVIYGWLQVGEIVRVKQKLSPAHQWAREYHPHFDGHHGANNTVYIASDRLEIGGVACGLDGGGVFKRFHEGLRLTAPEAKRRSRWLLPKWFYPRGKQLPLSYHANMRRWESHDDYTILNSVARGQEFVLDTDHHPEAIGWIRDIVAHAH
jgi:hypothetical protein